MTDIPLEDRIVQAAKRDMLNTYGGYNETHARTTIAAAFRELANQGWNELQELADRVEEG